ncbi:MAG: undecaprenyldiphospho-muramoylpentapeptide beta-N-acetylglucosaminyltransferase [Actinomycetota bacterium]|nr:undecaprenyldiphospho-muramoylpentapeptide beta-N-acetylglucosaminyltransferase [Actinomycetota bacterium]
MNAVIAAGGTAGHIFPGLAVARALRDGGHDVTFVGTEERLEARLIPAAGFAFHPIAAAPFRRVVSRSVLRLPVVVLRAAGACRPIVRGADVVVGMGGYVSVPAVLAARRERRPVVLHEQNAVPGLANRVLARIADAVALSFSEAARKFPKRVDTSVTGNPVRDEIARVSEDRALLAKEAREEFGLDEGRKTILVFGGSQGALHLDRAAAGACRALADRRDLQVVLVTGPAHFDSVRRALPTENNGIAVRAFDFIERIELAYAVADLAVARAGATTVAELSVCGIPAVLIPYPYATGRHQEANARALQRAGGASVMLDEHLSAATLARRIETLVDHDERLEAMRVASRAFGQPDAAVRLADVVTTTAGRKTPA